MKTQRANVADVMPGIMSPQAVAVFDQLLDRAQRRCAGRLAGLLPDGVREAYGRFRAADVVQQHRERTRRILARFTKTNPRALMDSSVWAEIDGWMASAGDHVRPFVLLAGIQFHEARVRNACAQVGLSGERLLSAERAASKRSIDWSLRRSARHERDAAWADFEKRLSWWRKWTMLRAVRRSMRQIKRYERWREQVRSDLGCVLASMRVWHLVLAERFVQRGWLDRTNDYFLLHLPEIASVIRGVCHGAALGAIASQRRAKQRQINRFSLAQAS